MNRVFYPLYSDLEAVILFSGNVVSTFQISEAFENFVYVEITYQYAEWASLWKTVRIYPGSSTGNLDAWYYTTSTAQYYWKWFSAGGKQISLWDGYFYDFDTKAMDTNVNIIEVTKVIGYRK